MKQYLIKILIPAILTCLMLQSCTKDFKNINTNPNSATNALPSQLLAPALVNTLTVNMLRNRSFNNELMQVTVNQSDDDGMIFRYDIKDSWSDYPYNGWYSELTNFREIYNLSNDSLTRNTSYMGISLICQAWVFSLLTDTYGEIPFKEALLAKDSSIYEPKFDKQQVIYDSLFTMLENANTLLSQGSAITASSDPVYYGDVSKWRKLGNALYLRLLLRVSGKSAIKDSCISKINQIVTQSAVYPIMTSNSDAAYLKWTGSGAYVSPLMGVREQDFRTPAICSFFIDHLSNWADPRINYATYGDNGVCRWRIVAYNGAYVGVPSGYAAGEGVTKKSYFYSTSSSLGETLMNDPMTGIIMNYAEQEFILTEAAAKGWISGDPGGYYNNGVSASINFWVPSFTQSITDYLNAADMQWDNSLSLDDKMEKIHLQKYYALFLVDFQQWFEYRRTGHPILPKGDGLKNGGIMPARLKYPVYIQSSNPTNYKLAIKDQGVDSISTNVWWQKP